VGGCVSSSVGGADSSTGGAAPVAPFCVGCRLLNVPPLSNVPPRGRAGPDGVVGCVSKIPPPPGGIAGPDGVVGCVSFPF
jgi:hypothetical protein